MRFYFKKKTGSLQSGFPSRETCPARMSLEVNMRCVVQRVLSASVTVEGETVASIGPGLLVYLGIEKGDSGSDLEAMAEKVVNLRVFEDDRGAMNLSLADVSGEALVISQFTLLGDCRRGRRPSFTDAMEPGPAKELYDRFADEMSRRSIPVKKGRFRAFMHVTSVNQGPVTLMLDSRKRF
jgi:D-tyrosyl-tRNA(Tyr) deacylase